MSLRAYRIIEITSEEASFNLWHDHELMQFLHAEADFFGGLGSDGTGLTSVPVGILQKAVRRATKLKLSAETVKRLKQDVAWAKSNKDETVTYHCF
jgi:hypothetical protein